MQNYSHALDVDMLNQRYWYRRMQQCKAEFKASYSRPVAPKLASNSVNLSTHSSSVDDPLPSSTQSPTPSFQEISITGTQSRSLSRTVIPKPLSQPMAASVSDRVPEEQPSQPDPWVTASSNGLTKERPILASSKSSRPIKYQVR